MFLKYLQIVNYKNLRSARFSFVEGVNTVIGENDSGKSNAMTALRILLDDTYYYNTKRLKENDFSDSLGNWKGHWIILSAVFGKITSEDKETEVCAGIVPENENEEFLKSYIKSGEDDIGVISLFIRPQKQVRKKLSEITDIAEFEEERKKIKISDCNGVQREHNKKLNNGLPILHKVPPKRDYGRYFCIMAEKGGTSHGGLTEKLSLFFHAKKQEVNAYGR